jgi:hypothetical protein
MSTLIFINSNIPEYEMFKNCVKVAIGEDFLYNSNVNRIGFVWENNKCLIPFGVLPSELNTHYFTKEFVDYLQQYTNPITVDLITCSLDSPIFNQDLDTIKNILPNVTFNYSVNLTGNSPQGDWIMESSGEDIKNIYFNDNINEYNYVFALPSDGSLGGNFSYNLNGSVRTFTLDTNFTTDTWSTIDITHSSGTDQVIIDGNNKTITIDQADFTGLFYAGNTFNSNTKPTIIKNFILKCSVDINVALSKIIGNTEFDNCHLELIANINNNGGGLVHNSAGGSGIKINMANCSTKIFGKIGSNAGPLIGYIQLNSGNSYTIDECCSIVSDNDSLNGITMGSSSGVFVGSGISNTVNITNSYCIFNGSMSNGSSIIAGKFLGSSGTVTINKFYAVTNITYKPNNDGDASQNAYNMSSYFGGFLYNSNSLSDVNILHLGLNLDKDYGPANNNAPIVYNLANVITYTSYATFAATAHTESAKIGTDEYTITFSGNNTFYSFTTNNINDWSLDLDNSILKCVSVLSTFTIENQLLNYIPFTPTLPTISFGNGNITYSSNNTSVATVNAITGLITMVNGGTVTITATLSSTDQYTQITSTSTFVISIDEAAVTNLINNIMTNENLLEFNVQNFGTNNEVVSIIMGGLIDEMLKKKYF